ncbi:hypothetical protein TNIN_353941 [Trichonephila inaurata madagascariensis]|uniref:Uncharacterized protein n=1 Tax=Trichonephila inaurata madagascariensis TaxID=2747483 RepID=A0A8X6XP51_9ARAC|nr:hypothetical protein TNIN_353941 [Trichonephila inaurata madagascariensis]
MLRRFRLPSTQLKVHCPTGSPYEASTSHASSTPALPSRSEASHCQPKGDHGVPVGKKKGQRANEEEDRDSDPSPPPEVMTQPRCHWEDVPRDEEEDQSAVESEWPCADDCEERFTSGWGASEPSEVARRRALIEELPVLRVLTGPKRKEGEEREEICAAVGRRPRKHARLAPTSQSPTGCPVSSQDRRTGKTLP